MTPTGGLPIDRIHRKPWVTVLVSILASAYILAAYSSFTRPIWIDEFLHFAFGSHRSTSETWQSISDTLPTFNFGQTGFHMLVNYWTLHHFGASSFLMRLPSLLAAGLLLFSSVQIAIRLRFGPAWTLLLLASYFCQQNLMHYAGEARPYMPLAASVMGMLAFYLIPSEERTLLTRLLGAFSISLGAIFHPYFAFYWLLLAILTFIFQETHLTWRLIFSGFIRHCDPLISAPAAIAYLLLAKLTWLKGTPDFQMDPFQWIKGDGLFTTFSQIAHFQFLGKAHPAPFFFIGAVLLASAIPRVRHNPHFRRLAPPIALLVLALGISLFLSAASYHRNYWILPRQWVASQAICCLAVIWFAREIGELARTQWRYLHIPILGLIGYLLLQTAPSIYRAKAVDVAARAHVLMHPVESANRPEVIEPTLVPVGNDEWVALANQNIKAGGPVWAIFRKFYGRAD